MIIIKDAEKIECGHVPIGYVFECSRDFFIKTDIVAPLNTLCVGVNLETGEHFFIPKDTMVIAYNSEYIVRKEKCTNKFLNGESL